MGRIADAARSSTEYRVVDFVPERQTSSVPNLPVEAIAKIGSDLRGNGATKHEPAVQPQLLRLDQVTPASIQWLWRNHFPLSMLSLITGDPSNAKSTLVLDIAARLTAGRPMPDGSQEIKAPAGVVILSAEDDPSTVIRPRFDAADGDPERVNIVTTVKRRGKLKPVNLAEDLIAVREAIEQTLDCRMVIVDPLTAYLGGVDSHRDSNVRSVLAPLATLAQKTGVAVVVVMHANKSSGRSAMYRTGGSIAFVAAARAAWAVGPDPDDETRKLFVPVKTNLSPTMRGMAYRVVGDDVPDIGSVPRIEWLPGTIATSAREVLDGTKGEPRTAVEDAADWLEEYLADGPQSASDVRADAEAAGHAWRTMQDAKARIGVRSAKGGLRAGWAWILPQERDAEERNASTTQAAPFGSRDPKEASAENQPASSAEERNDAGHGALEAQAARQVPDYDFPQPPEGWPPYEPSAEF